MTKTIAGLISLQIVRWYFYLGMLPHNSTKLISIHFNAWMKFFRDRAIIFKYYLYQKKFVLLRVMSKICLDMLYLSNILPYYPAIVTQNLYVMYVSWNFTKSYDFSIEKLNHFSFINYALVIESISYQYLQWSRLYYISFCVLVVGKVGNSFAGKACFLQLEIKKL